MEIISNVGVGDILLNSSRLDVREALRHYKIEEFKRTVRSELAFHVVDLGVFVYFDKNGLCEAIEFSNATELFFSEIFFQNGIWRN